MRRAGNIGCLGGNHETIPFPRDRLDIERFVRGVSQRLAKLVYSGIDVGVVVDVSVGGPEALAQLLSSNDLTRFLEERDEDLIHLTL
jgi:hypothetical protein